MNSCERAFMKILYILIFIFGLCTLIFTIIEITKDYGFKNILSLIENFISNLEITDSACDDYISDLKSSKKMAKAKTIVNLVFIIFRVIYCFFRLKNLDKFCRLGIIFFLILFSEHIIVLSITSAMVNQYKYDFT